MALNAQITLSILAHETSSGDISRTLRATPVSYALSLTDGTGANQAQVVWSDSRTLSGSPDTLALGSLTDDRGTVTFTAIKVIYIKNNGNATMLWSDGTWGGGPFDDISSSPVSIRPGGVLAIAAPDASGFSVDVGSQTIVLSSASSGVAYDIALIGEGSVA